MDRICSYLPLVMLTIVAGLPCAASAQEPDAASASPPSRRVIEEIIVTAQKVEQNLRDVPISMSVLDSDFLAGQGVTDFRDVALYAGNFKINNDGGAFPPPDIRVRGFGTAEGNRFFEQSVGLALDGDTFGQQEYFQAAMFDVSRVEVLKGPQGTLFGKNTTAGLLNVVLAEPTEDLSGFVDVQLGELDRRRIEAAAGGPVVADWLNVRLSGLLDERDGFVRNTTAATVAGANDRLGERSREAIRAKLQLPDVGGADLRLTAEQSEATWRSSGVEIADPIPSQQAFARKYDPNADLEKGNYVGSVDLGDVSRRKIRRFAASAGYDWNGWGLDAVLGYATLDSTDFVDADFGPAPVGFADVRDGHEQSSVELRGASPEFAGLFGLPRVAGFALGTTDVAAGFFFQRKRVRADFETAVNFPVFGEFIAAGEGVTPNPAGADAMREAPTSSLFTLSKQKTLSYAGFTQLRWRPAARSTLEFGMRVTQETKTADLNRFFDNAATEAVFVQVFGLQSFSLEGLRRSELGFSPKVALIHDVTDDINVFATWAIGFKSGGFNEIPTTTRPESLTYKPETMRSWEVGSKTRLFDGTATLNAQLFWMDATDLQVFTIEPANVAIGFATATNAGKARVRGVEIDGTWLPTDWGELRGTLGFNDTEFIEFPFATCEIDRQDTDGDGDPRCALDGEPLPFTPKWDASLSPSVRVPLGSVAGAAIDVLRSVDFVTGLTLQYEDVHFVNRSDDPRTRQPAYVKLDAKLGLDSPENGWSLTFNGQNLTDESTYFLRRTTNGAGGAFLEFMDPPRLFFATFRWVFA